MQSRSEVGRPVDYPNLTDSSQAPWEEVHLAGMLPNIARGENGPSGSFSLIQLNLEYLFVPPQVVE
jgi:hypothetical protein